MPKQTFAAHVTDHIEMCCISNQNDRSNGSFMFAFAFQLEIELEFQFRAVFPI